MANIAEGFERESDKEFQRFLTIAKGSAGEVRSHLYVAGALGYLSTGEFERLSKNPKRPQRPSGASLPIFTGSSVLCEILFSPFARL